MTNVYFISGLGADKSAFQKTVLPENFTPIHIEWIIPQKKESLINYSLRLTEKIDTTKPFVLIGLSFGGMVVSELSNILNPVKSILISSAATCSELPWYYRLIGTLNIHKILPTNVLKSRNKLTFWAFGAETPEEKNILTEILKNIHNGYLRWSVDAIFKWQNKKRAATIFHLHGTNDHILPHRYVKCDATVSNGRHFMVLSRYKEVNQLLSNELKKLAL